VSYVVLARKYRPTTFDEVVGQEPIAQTLRNAIETNHVAHAYLFCGPRGVGKTSMARILAMALNCTSAKGPTSEPCGKCASCKGIYLGEDMDVREIDGASNNHVEDVRKLRDNAIYRPSHSRFKVYIIDEVHMLSPGAFNALLKILEEPPEHVKFIFATTDVHKIPETIQSRCQRFDFKNISTADIVKRLGQVCKAEKVKASEEVLVHLARRARGGMRDSQSLLDQLIAFSPGEITREAVDFVLGKSFDEEIDRLLEAFRAKDSAEALRAAGSLISAGQDLTEFLGQLAETLRSLMVIKACGRDDKLLDLPSERVQKLEGFAPAFSLETVLYMLQAVGEADRKMRTATEKRIVFESTLVKLATMEDLKPLAEILERLSALSGRVAASGPSAPAAPSAAPAPRPAAPARTPAPAPAPAKSAERPPEPEEAPYEETPEPPSAPAPTGELGTMWSRMLALVKTRKTTVAARLREGQPTEVRDDHLIVTFPPGYGFHRQQLSEKEQLEFIEKCLSEVVGKPMRISLVGGEKVASAEGGRPSGGQGGSTQGAGKSRGRAHDNPAVRKATEIFGGRVVEEE
jgi:DNA polymerase-3 subunit gamma/tau